MLTGLFVVLLTKMLAYASVGRLHHGWNFPGYDIAGAEPFTGSADVAAGKEDHRRESQYHCLT